MGTPIATASLEQQVRVNSQDKGSYSLLEQTPPRRQYSGLHLVGSGQTILAGIEEIPGVRVEQAGSWNKSEGKVSEVLVSFQNTDGLIKDVHYRSTPQGNAYAHDGDFVIGPNSIYGLKRLIGQKFDKYEHAAITKHLPFKIGADVVIVTAEPLLLSASNAATLAKLTKGELRAMSGHGSRPILQNPTKETLARRRLEKTICAHLADYY